MLIATEEIFVSAILDMMPAGHEPTPAEVEAKVDELRVGTWQNILPHRNAVICEIVRRINVRINMGKTSR